MRFQIANPKQVFLGLSLSILVGSILAYGFIPLSYRLFQDPLLAPAAPFSFVLVAFGFFISLPNTPCAVFSTFGSRRLLTLCVLPLLISAVFGITKVFPEEFRSAEFFPWKPLIWAWILAPIGEELLFRGWFTSLLNRLNRNVFLGVVPLFPLSIWGSALAFSIWHLQNSDSLSLSFFLLQIITTFFVGIWLGFLRWQTQKLWPCVLAQLLLNLCADWKLWFMLL